MSDNAQPPPVSFHYNYDRKPGQPFGFASYMVIISDEALLALAKNDPARSLAARFNGGTTPAQRVIALGQILHAAEKRGDVTEVTKPRFILLRRALVFLITAFTR